MGRGNRDSRSRELGGRSSQPAVRTGRGKRAGNAAVDTGSNRGHVRAAPDDPLPAQASRLRVIRVEVVGGPCGKPVRFPNSKVKRGWSQTRAKWRFEDERFLDRTIRCGGQFYKLVREGDKWFYVHDPGPTVLPRITRAIGGSPFWRRLFPVLCPPDERPGGDARDLGVLDADVSEDGIAEH